MLFQMIWYFILLCVLVKGNEDERFYKQNQISVNARVKGKLADFSSATERIEARAEETKIIKRGIVLVDEDFDVPSAIYAHENNSGTNVSLNTDLFEKNEGSGDDELDVKEVTNTEMTFTHMSSTKQSPSLLTTKVKLTTIKNTVSPIVTKDTIMSSTDFESSGDDTVITTNEYVVTELTTSQITELLHEEIPYTCLNSTCSPDDLIVSLSNDKNLIAEGTNISLLCQSNNSTRMLYWYKSNGTAYFLQAFGAGKELQFNIPDTKSVHSGLYKCVKWINTETCCNLELNLSVYEIPLYKYYLIILGLIVAACLIICILLSVRQTITLRIYTKQFVEKHGKDKPLL